LKQALIRGPMRVQNDDPPWTKKKAVPEGTAKFREETSKKGRQPGDAVLLREGR
jgi:hypothetical protein